MVIGRRVKLAGWINHGLDSMKVFFVVVGSLLLGNLGSARWLISMVPSA